MKQITKDAEPYTESLSDFVIQLNSTEINNIRRVDYNRSGQRERESVSPETDPAAKSAGDGMPVKDGPVEGGRPPREKPTAERVDHDR
jgi:hypothetical protein